MTGTSVVALVFAIVFLLRDSQVLTVRDRRSLATRFLVYVALLLAGIAVVYAFAGAHPKWMQRRFALVAIFVQVLEIAVALVLRRYALGRLSWLGCILPAPAFLVTFGIIGVKLQEWFPALGGLAVLGMLIATWLSVLGGSISVLCRMEDPWEDRKFAADFAMMTGCTALIFVPFGY